MIFFGNGKNVSVAFICISLTQIEYQSIQDVGRIMENQNIKQDVPFRIVHSCSMLGFVQTVTYDVHKTWFCANLSCFVYATRIPLISQSFKIFWWKSWKMLRCYNISISLYARKNTQVSITDSPENINNRRFIEAAKWVKCCSALIPEYVAVAGGLIGRIL